jgi:hypothetical protein
MTAQRTARAPRQLSELGMPELTLAVPFFLL